MSYSHHIFKLKKKISGIAVRIPCAKTSTLIIAVKVGSQDEKPTEYGLAHLLEHMMFRGSKQIPNSTELTKEMDNLGAVFNAFVSKHVTYYHCKFYWNDQNFKKLVQLLAGLVLSPLFREKDLNLERNVVLSELDQYLNDDEEHLDKMLTESILGQHPLAHDITGTKEIIKKMKVSNLKSFYQNHYHANNLFVILTGKYTTQGLKNLESVFNQLEIPDAPRRVFTPPKPLTLESTQDFKVVTRKDNIQVVLGLGFPTIGFLDSRKEEMILLNSLIAGSDGSLLHRSLREEKGLVYSVSSNYLRYPDGGILIIKTSFKLSKLKQVLRIIYDEIENIKKQITLREMKQHLESLIGYTWVEAENIFNVAEHYAQELIFSDSVRPYHHQLKKFKKIKTSEVIKLANLVLDWNKVSLMTIGPLSKKDLMDSLPSQINR